MRHLLPQLAILIILPCLAQAQLRADFLTIHPESVSRDGAFLVLIRDQWLDGCGGTVEASISADRIEITSVLASPSLGAACTQIVIPFEEIINPAALAPDVDFADTVTISYRYDAGDGAEERASAAISFDDAMIPAATAQNGGWVTERLESSGLFLDQQGDILTAFLADYGEDGGPVWYYASGRVVGNAFSAPMQRFSEIVCVTAPCPRVAPDREGRIDLIIGGRDDLTVAYTDVLEGRSAELSGAFAYERLRFSRSGQLAGLPSSIPDLTGNWLAGARAIDGRSDDFRTVRIEFARVEDEGGAIPRYVFIATDLSQGDAAPDLEFEIHCADERPVDGVESCSVEGFEAPTGTCEVRFPYDDVGVDRVSAPASCDLAFDFETTFDLFRLD